MQHWASLPGLISTPKGLPQGYPWSLLSGHGHVPSRWPGFEYSKQSIDYSTSFPCRNVWEAEEIPGARALGDHEIAQPEKPKSGALASVSIC